MTSISEPVAITTDTGDGRPIPLVEMRDICVPSAVSTPSTGSASTSPAIEVVALVGGNGAGKSTLMKVLSGAQRADAARSTSTAIR